MPNHLASAQSAYLKSAAHQPIHWYPWGAEAFRVARERDVPILLDIGAVWCHWCHVMDGESYEDPAIAALLNEHFICVKVDRDERPDVDTRYQRAVQSLTGQGGWPLTGFLTPDGNVFYGGTYFPPDGKYGRPGFREVLLQVLNTYRSQRERVDAQATNLRTLLEENLDESTPGESSPALLQEAVDGIAKLFDFRNGGFGSQPKFPHPAVITFLLHRWFRDPQPWIREMIDRTLQGMARGGIHDQLAGGFHRYSVDARWIVPHFEKMAYDNAELLKAYLDAYMLFGDEEYGAVARGIVRWIREVMADPDGGYAASQDADVGLHDDGGYFTWTLEEAREAIGDEDALAVASAYYDIGTAGEMDHDPAKNVLFIADNIHAIATRLRRAPAEVSSLLDLAEEKLHATRVRRPAPYVDRTRYTNWNAMLASALLRAAPVLDDLWAEAHALTTLRRIRSESPGPDAVDHTAGGLAGLLDDQVQVAQAALDAHELTGDASWLGWAQAIMDRVWRDYLDADRGGLFDTASSPAGEGLLPTRTKPMQDAPTPSANGVAALVLARLFELTGNSKWQSRHHELVAAFSGRAKDLGLHGATLLLAIDWRVNPATRLVVVEETGRTGKTGRTGALPGESERMHRRALVTFLPRRVVRRVRVDSDPGALPPEIRGMVSAGPGPRAFACAGATCSAPATTDEEWRATLAGLQGLRD